MDMFVMHEYRSGRTATRTWWWPLVALVAALVLAVPTLASAATVYTEEKLLASDGAGGDLFGTSVAVDGDTIVVGASQDDNAGGFRAGAAYVYKPDGTGGTTQTKLTASDGAAFDLFGWSVAVDGGTIVVGAYLDDNAGGTQAGAAYVYMPDGTGGYTETAKLTASDGARDDLFGWSVAVDGDTIVVGAHYDDNDGGTRAGAAYVYTRDSSGVYTETAKLTASDTDDDYLFGNSVAVDGGTIVVGAYQATNAGGIFAGAAYVFTGDSSGGFTETAKLTASDGPVGDRFGWSVAVDGDTIVVGASWQDNAGGTSAGAAYVYMPDSSGGYTQTAKLTASDGAAYDFFGSSVAVDGDTIVVGASWQDNAGGTSAGAAYVYTAASDTDPDADGDGVADADDDCADTPLPDEATKQLKPNRYETVDVDGDGSWAFVDPAGKVAYTLADTRGCSLSQIVERAGLGKAHLWHGITGSALDTWVNG